MMAITVIFTGFGALNETARLKRAHAAVPTEHEKSITAYLTRNLTAFPCPCGLTGNQNAPKLPPLWANLHACSAHTQRDRAQSLAQNVSTNRNPPTNNRGTFVTSSFLEASQCAGHEPPGKYCCTYGVKNGAGRLDTTPAVAPIAPVSMAFSDKAFDSPPAAAPPIPPRAPPTSTFTVIWLADSPEAAEVYPAVMAPAIAPANAGLSTRPPTNPPINPARNAWPPDILSLPALE